MPEVQSRRTCLPDLPSSGGVSNAGLALQRYVKTLGGQNTGRDSLHKTVCASAAPEMYHHAFVRWRTELKARPGTCIAEFEARSPLIVGLGGESVLEAGITLHHTYGTPFIPGSALKGLTASVLRQQPAAARLPDAEMAVLFGTPESASYVRYFDAWYVPNSATDDRPLRQDVITVHHPKYYARLGIKREPWDLDDPTPVHYVNAVGNYLVAVQCAEDKAWAETALSILGHALAFYGVGAKTSSGYGRMRRLTAGLGELLAEISAFPANEDWLPVYNTFIQRVRDLPEHERGDPALELLQRMKAAGLKHPQGEIKAKGLLLWASKN